MNTFLTICQEFYSCHRSVYTYFKSIRREAIDRIKRVPLHYRITARGNREQYQSKYLPNYYGDRRLSRSHVFTVNTI